MKCFLDLTALFKSFKSFQPFKTIKTGKGDKILRLCGEWSFTVIPEDF